MNNVVKDECNDSEIEEEEAIAGDDFKKKKTMMMLTMMMMASAVRMMMAASSALIRRTFLVALQKVNEPAILRVKWINQRCLKIRLVILLSSAQQIMMI